jgi:RIO kinase 2
VDLHGAFKNVGYRAGRDALQSAYILSDVKLPWISTALSRTLGIALVGTLVVRATLFWTYDRLCSSQLSHQDTSTQPSMYLDASQLRHLSDAELRVLTAVELGMRNHERVPVELVGTLSGERIAYKALRVLLRHKLVHHESKPYESYRLTPLGYDYLALRALRERSSVNSVGRLLGTGKESDVHEVLGGVDGSERYALKVHRLGRTSFRQARTKRDYCVRGSLPLEATVLAHTENSLPAPRNGKFTQQDTPLVESSESAPPNGNPECLSEQLERRSVSNWLYLSRLAAQHEYEALELLFRHGLPVPEPIDANRHCVVQRLVQNATLLCHIRSLRDPEAVFRRLWEFQDRLAALGLVHGDLNEFNVLVDNDTEQIVVIDFPQVVPLAHREGLEMLERDRQSLLTFFRFRFGVGDRAERSRFSSRDDAGTFLNACCLRDDERVCSHENNPVIQTLFVTERRFSVGRSYANRSAYPGSSSISPAISGDTSDSASTEGSMQSLACQTKRNDSPSCKKQGPQGRDPTNSNTDGLQSFTLDGEQLATGTTEEGCRCESAYPRAQVTVSVPDMRTISRRLQAQYTRSQRNKAVREAMRLSKSRPRASQRAEQSLGWF